MTNPRTRSNVHAHDAVFQEACPVCGGALKARLTPGGVWAWCRACRRLSKAAVVAGPAGPVLLHPAAVA